MNDLEEQQAAQRAWLNEIMAEFGIDATNLARAAGISPSTLTRFMKNDWPGLLSTLTLHQLRSARRQLAKEHVEATSSGPSFGKLHVDSEYVRDFLNSPENQAFLRLWGGFSDDTKLVVLDILEALGKLIVIARREARKTS